MNANTSMQTPRLALIGGGAIAEKLYLPALTHFPAVLRQLVLVDSNPARLNALGTQFDVPEGQRERYYDSLRDQVDGVIIALPHQLHYQVARTFLQQGIPVLCEKPLTESVTQARELVALAEQHGVALAVNNTRRLFPAYADIQRRLAHGDLGELVSLRYVDGEQFNWPTASGFYFQAKRRGVLFDRGVHGLDAICWWLGGQPALVSAETDSFGGVEGVAQVRFQHGACSGQVTLNWLNKLPNRFQLVGREATIESGIEDWWGYTLRTSAGKEQVVRLPAVEKTYDEFGVRLVSNFIEVVEGRAEPLIPASAVVDSLAWIDECYARATRPAMAWYQNWQAPEAQGETRFLSLAKIMRGVRETGFLGVPDER